MRKLILAAVAAALAPAWASPAAAYEATPPNEYVVYVEGAALRAEPSDEGEVSEVLPRGARVKNLSEVITELEGRYWRQVEVAGESGWLADGDVIPASFYDRFKKADELGRAGDAEGMLEEVWLGAKAEKTQHHVSPDRLKAVVELIYAAGRPEPWYEIYPPSDRRFGSNAPFLYFENGRGLSRYFIIKSYESQWSWCSDSRHFFYNYYDAGRRIGFSDTDTWEQLELALEAYESARRGPEVVGEYLVYLIYEELADPPPPYGSPFWMPALVAYDVSTGKTLRLLEADRATLRDEEVRFNAGGEGYRYYPIKMVAAETAPAALRESGLLKEYERSYYVLAREAAESAAGEAPAPPDEYVVYVEGAALRAEPSDDAEISGALPRGARVKNLSEVTTEVEGRYWRQVEVAGESGWVADGDVIPAYFYDPFKEADELARAGDAEGMVVAIVKGVCAVYDAEMQPLTNYCLSPDGSKVLVNFGRSRIMPTTWSEMYGGRGYYNEPVPLLFFAAGRGLARYFQIYGYHSGEWFPDSRHLVYPVYWYSLALLNVDTWEQLELGDLYWREGGWDHEIIGDYLVWLGYERPENPPARLPEIQTPVLMAYDVSTGETLRLLEADLTTLEDKDGPFTTGGGYDYYEIKIVPATAVPAPLRRSKLYEKYNGAHALARESYA